ncbi:MAG: hypothetical protein IT371_04115 [Deltaproteobacteria bacterium]|nr:hypothetical protein [Deltaproteobacteria bacterium]
MTPRTRIGLLALVCLCALPQLALALDAPGPPARSRKEQAQRNREVRHTLRLVREVRVLMRTDPKAASRLFGQLSNPLADATIQVKLDALRLELPKAERRKAQVDAGQHKISSIAIAVRSGYHTDALTNIARLLDGAKGEEPSFVLTKEMARTVRELAFNAYLGELRDTLRSLQSTQRIVNTYTAARLAKRLTEVEAVAAMAPITGLPKSVTPADREAVKQLRSTINQLAVELRVYAAEHLR